MSKAKAYTAATGAVLAALFLGIIAAPNIVNAGQATQVSVGATVTCVSDSTSGCTITHSYGVKPDSVTVTAGGKGQLASVPADKVTATSYRVNFNWHNGTSFPKGTRFTFQVHVDLPDSPTPSPTPSPSPSPTPTPTPTPSPSPTPTAQCVWSTSKQMDGHDFGNNWHVNNEVWNGAEAGTQTMCAQSYKQWTVVANHPKPGADKHSIKSYPDTQKLFSDPKLSSLTTVSSSFSQTTPTVGEWNWSYDIWMNGWSTELMIWTQHRYGGENAAPLPPGDAQETATVTINGIAYTAWRRDREVEGDRNYIALVMDETHASGTVNLRAVFDWLISKGWLQAAATLQAVDYGVEIADTAGGPQTFKLNDFSLSTS
jgi:hypothetical protein